MKPTKLDSGLVKTSLRLPEHLYLDLVSAAVKNGRAMNAEAIARLEHFDITTRLAAIERDNAEIKTLLRELLDR